MKTATVIPGSRTDDSRSRLHKLRSLAWFLDNAIPLPGGFRIGLDPIIGLLPGVGDAIGALFSAYILNEARILGAPRSVLLRMAGNVLIETIIGTIPFIGDLFDMAFKANARNIALLELHELDPVGTTRGSRVFVIVFSLFLIALIAAMIALPVLIVIAIVRAF